MERPVLCPVLIGRAPHLDALTRAADQAALGKGHAVLVAGEAGIGKSRLLTEAAGRAHAFSHLQGHGYETDVSVPFAPFVDALRSSESIDIRADIRRTSSPVVAELARIVPDLASPVERTPSRSHPQDEKRRLFRAIATLLFEISDRGLLLLTVEDLHWCAPYRRTTIWRGS
ncbi:MAG: hypothetical protein A2Z37_08605 [Chloroflexi bacterium RBG_19FT_COMBO_62_14]|nr:MAG: hypothetical protein A2Z37_08605 [Chloroflexi bacterium RBG_19FT_COMBO_62_14]